MTFNRTGCASAKINRGKDTFPNGDMIWQRNRKVGRSGDFCSYSKFGEANGTTLANQLMQIQSGDQLLPTSGRGEEKMFCIKSKAVEVKKARITAERL